MAAEKLQFRIHVLLAGALLTASCIDSYAASPDSEPQSLQPRAAFVDARGLRWQLRRHVERLSAQEPRSPQGAQERAAPKVSADALRPIALTPRNDEYVLDEADSLVFLEQLRELAPTLPRSAPMAVPDGAQLSERTTRVLFEDRFPTQTFGDDGRANMNSEAHKVPWSFIGAMANAGQCTAFKLLNKHTAITAAHCVHDGAEWRQRKTLQFAAGAASAHAELSDDCYTMIVPGGWNGEDAEFDYAVLRLREDGLEGGASCDRAAYDVGHFGYQLVDECVDGIPLTLAGYPSRSDPDNPTPIGEWSYPSLFTDYRTDGWTACAGLYEMALLFYNDGSNGQSGSPVWSFYEDSGQNQVRGIYRGSMTTVIGDSNRARRFDESLIAWLTLNAGY